MLENACCARGSKYNSGLLLSHNISMAFSDRVKFIRSIRLIINFTKYMRVVLTEKQAITSKKGDEWVKISYLAQDGRTGSVFVSKVQYQGFELPEDRVVSEKEIDDLFENSSPSDVEFDERGRVVGIK